MTPRRFLSAAEVADRLGVPEPTLRHWRTKRTGPQWVRIGKYVRYPSDKLQQWEDTLIARSVG